jgi:hypothetical protein
MHAGITLILNAGLATGLAVLTVLVLRSSFLRLLVDLCRSEIRGRFWLAFASVSIVLTTLFGSLAAFPTGQLASWRGEWSLEIVVASFRAGLSGLILSLAAVALVLLVSSGQRGFAPGASTSNSP